MIRDQTDEMCIQFNNFNQLGIKKATFTCGSSQFSKAAYFFSSMNLTASAAFTNPPVIHVSVISPDFFALGI
jgi:hypothetical protein